MKLVICHRRHRFVALACLLIAGSLPGAGEGEMLLPLDVSEAGWVFNADLGWSHASPLESGGVWMWIPKRFPGGLWIFATESTYPWYWNQPRAAWENIYRNEIGTIESYFNIHDQDYLTGNTFRSIEAFVKTEGSPGEIAYMRPAVVFREDNGLVFHYSDTVSVGYVWTYVRGWVLTNHPVVGVNLGYNPTSRILLVDGRKYRLVDDTGNFGE